METPSDRVREKWLRHARFDDSERQRIGRHIYLRENPSVARAERHARDLLRGKVKSFGDSQHH